MAGIKGQPSPGPKDVPNPVPKVDYSELEGIDYSELDSSSPSPVSAPQDTFVGGYDGPGAGALQFAADVAPTALGIAGAIGGAALGPAGSVAGAALGGAAGTGYRAYIEQILVGSKPLISDQQMAKDVASSAAVEVGGQLLGLGALKLGKAGAQRVAKYIAQPLEAASNSFRASMSEVMQPLTDLLSSISTEMSPLAAGDTIKELMGKKIYERMVATPAKQVVNGVERAIVQAPLSPDEVAIMNKVIGTPSEQLVKNLFTTNNARALEVMEKKTPEVFELVKQSKISQIIQEAMPDGPTGMLDLNKFRRIIYNPKKLPTDVRGFLFSDDDLKLIN